jgi:diguanylate cyclase (GGDEF)-like protein/PAS domain S-box-containing protein
MTAPSPTVLAELVASSGLVLALLILTIRVRRGQRAILNTGDELARTEERFRRLSESSPLGIFELDATGRRIYANPRLIEIVRGNASDTGELSHELPPWNVPAEEAPARLAEWQAASTLMRPHSGRWRIERQDGELRWIRFDAAPLVRDGVLTGWIGSVADVTEEQERAEQHARLSDIIAATPDLVTMIDGQGRFTYVNEAAREVWGLDDAVDVRQITALDMYGTSSRDLVARDALPTALRDGVWSGEVMLRHADGRELPVSQVVVAHRLGDGTVDYLSCISRDISERREFEAQLVYQGLHDALTGLPNRVLFADRLDQALVRAARHKNVHGVGPATPHGGTIAVFLLDLDHFKLINDSYGHDVGDQLLLRATTRIEDALRPGDTAARFSGDEFAVLCEELRDPGQAIEIAERIAAALAAPFDLDEAPGDHEGTTRVFLTASIGIAIPSDATSTPESLLRDADAALNRAKDDGRARHVLFVEDYRHSAVHRLRTANDLHQALGEQEFRVVYQPEVSLTDGHVVAVEALVRWHHPERGLVPPAEFVPLAEETGLIVPIGAWVLDRAAEQAAVWARRSRHGAPVTVWVNLSARQLAQDDLVETVAATLTRHRLVPHSIGLEITETALLEDAEHAIGMLGALRSLGVRLAVDDFGTGYSSLAYLKRLPVDQLKVDKSFVEGLETDDEASAIVAAVTGLARALSLTTVAEGVETIEQLEVLRRLDCDIAQGYYFTTPQPPANITRLLEADRLAPLFPPPELPATARPALRLAAVGTSRTGPAAADHAPPLPHPRPAGRT